MNSRKRTLGKTGCLSAGGLAFVVFACLGGPLSPEIVFALTAGWWRHAVRISGDVTIAPLEVITFAAVCVPATLVLAGLIRRAAPGTASDGQLEVVSSSTRPVCLALRAAELVASLSMLLFAGTCAVAIARHATWLSTTPGPLVETGRVSSRRAGSRNAMQAIGSGVIWHHQERHAYPVKGTFSPSGAAIHSWMTFLLPYMEQAALFRRLDLSQPWTAPRNRPLLTTKIAVYRYPDPYQDLLPPDVDGLGVASFAGNVHVLGPGRSQSIDEVTDGTSETILMGEVREAFRAWGDPRNLRDPAAGVKRGPASFGAPGPAPTQFLMCSGHVRPVADNVDAEILRQLATPSGHDGGTELLERFR